MVVTGQVAGARMMAWDVSPACTRCSGSDPVTTVRRTDTLAVEEPLEIRLDGEPFAVTMRTPGDDVDLVHGLLHARASSPAPRTS